MPVDGFAGSLHSRAGFRALFFRFGLRTLADARVSL